MKRKSIFIAETVMIGVAYVVLVLALQPISFMVVQVRLADALLPLSMVYGWSAILGLTIGCAIANLYSPVPQMIVDVIMGSIANFLATYAAYRVGRDSPFRILVGSMVEALIVTLIVGSYLAILLNVPFEFSYLGVGIGSLISIIVVGSPIAITLSRYVKRSH